MTDNRITPAPVEPDRSPVTREPDRGPVTRVYGWQWGADDERRPGLPWIGIFLLVFGGLLLVERFVPGFRLAGSAFLLAVGIVLLVRWFIEHSTAALYGGAIITALALPSIIESSGVVGGPGLGALCLGVAFLFIALVRSSTGGGLGWQTWLGGILAIYGLSRLALPDFGQILLPLVLVVLGVLLVARGSVRR